MSKDALIQILDLARWAPSGDNTQPWSFEIVDKNHVRVHGHDTRDHILDDLEGHPSHIAHGALLETMRIAASTFGKTCHWTVTSDSTQRHLVYDVTLSDAPHIQCDPLADCIKKRTVQRRPMKTTPLSDAQRSALLTAAGEKYVVRLFEAPQERRQIAKLLWDSAKIRLTCPEAYPVHKSIIDWRTRYSKDRIPEEAIGVDPLTARLMEWVMHSWQRVQFFNRYLGGTIAPRIQLDVLPAWFCAAHLLIQPRHHPHTIDDWLNLGSAIQRTWLTVTHLGLHLQPQMTPVIFRWYARQNRQFSSDSQLTKAAEKISGTFEKISNAKTDTSLCFFARVGTSNIPRSRSTRKEVSELLAPGNQNTAAQS